MAQAIGINLFLEEIFMALNGKELAKIVDATVINPDATVADMEYLIEKAEGISFWRGR